MEEFQSQKIKAVIKNVLKRKNLTYEQVAEELECSVPTVKRILGPEELTLNRLLQLCELTDTTLAEIEGLTQESELKEESFTEKQEIFLAKNQNFFSYLLKLFDGKTPQQIAEDFKLNQRSTDKYLIGLEMHDLIRVTGKQRVKPAFKRPPKLGNGLLARTYFSTFIRAVGQFFEQIIHEGLMTPKGQKPESTGQFVCQLLTVSKSTYDAWLEEQEKSFQKLQSLSSYEEKSKDPTELQSAVVVRATAYVKNDHSGYKKLENAAGDIHNI